MHKKNAQPHKHCTTTAGVWYPGYIRPFLDHVLEMITLICEFQISTCLPFAIPNLYLSAIRYSKSQLVNHSLFQISTCLLFQSSSCLLFNICTCPLFLISMHPPCLLTFPDLHVPILSVNVAIQTVHTDLTAQNGNKHLRRRRWGDILSILMSSAHNRLSA